jgi:hypothetical protein
MSTSITTDISNYAAQGHGDLSHSMKALTWQGKNSVKVGQSFFPLPPSFILCISTQLNLICLYHL